MDLLCLHDSVFSRSCFFYKYDGLVGNGLAYRAQKTGKIRVIKYSHWLPSFSWKLQDSNLHLRPTAVFGLVYSGERSHFLTQTTLPNTWTTRQEIAVPLSSGISTFWLTQGLYFSPFASRPSVQGCRDPASWFRIALPDACYGDARN